MEPASGVNRGVGEPDTLDFFEIKKSFTVSECMKRLHAQQRKSII
jgi:hypothetical protein